MPMSSRLLARLLVLTTLILAFASNHPAHATYQITPSSQPQNATTQQNALFKTAALNQRGEIELSVRDNLSGVDRASIRLFVNGKHVSPSISPISKGYRLTFLPRCINPLNGYHLVRIEAKDRAGNWMRQVYHFVGAAMKSASNPQECSKAPRTCDMNQQPLPASPSCGQPGWKAGSYSPVCVSRGNQRLPLDLAAESLPSGPTAMLLGVGPEDIFRLEIDSRASSRPERSVRTFVITVRHGGPAVDSLALFVGVITPAGDAVLYEGKPGLAGVSLSSLSKKGDGCRQFVLPLPQQGLQTGEYVLCAAVADAANPSIVWSNVALARFDIAPQPTSQR